MNNFDVLSEFIKKTPKTELHLHIEGSLEPELMFKLSKRNKVEIPFRNVDEIRSAYNFTNLDSFLKIYYQGSNVLKTEEDFFDLTWEYILRCKQDNIVHTEIFFDPQSHLPRGVSFKTIINGINKALNKARDELNISSKIIMCFLRHLDEESCFDVLKQACDHKDKIIGVGLDSSEKGNPPQKFKSLFETAIKEGFLTVAHAGEEGPADYIWQALDLLKVKRIDHGIQCLGATPIDLTHVDFLSAGGHKWLMGLEGTGILYAKESVHDQLSPNTAGWISHENGFQFLFEGAGHLRYDRPIIKNIHFIYLLIIKPQVLPLFQPLPYSL